MYTFEWEYTHGTGLFKWEIFWSNGSGLFGCGYFLGCALFLGMPQVSGDSESIHTHAQGTRWKRVELLPVRAVFIDGLHGRRGNGTWPDAADSPQLIRLAVWSVDGTELTAGIPQQDHEMTGWALFHLLQSENTEKPLKSRQNVDEGKTWRPHTSTILFFWNSLTLPARQQCERALWMMYLFDLKLGSLNNLGPETD